MHTIDPVLAPLVGDSPAMQAVRSRITTIGPSDVPVLILGETGTGKELVATALVRASGRQYLVPVNCAALVDNLADAELFGYRKGAFTGAIQDRPGLIAEANGGTLFLDELAEMSPAVQSKLLRTLESGEYRPVGATQARKSSFRIIAATSADLDDALATGRLRSDLIYRLGALRIALPPLRDRIDDIPEIGLAVLKQLALRRRNVPQQISAPALRLLREQPWPGNVRQLRNVIEAAVALGGNSQILDAGPVADVLCVEGPALASAQVQTLAEAMLEAERAAFRRALEETGGNRETASRLLGISPATFYRRLARLRLNGSNGASTVSSSQN